MEYYIEKINPEDFDQLIPLMQDCFGMDVNIDYFRWKYIENPCGDLVAYVAKDPQGNVIGFEGSIPEYYFINNEQKILYQSVDSMTHSSHRKKGIFKKLSFACYDYMKQNNNFFILGFGGKDSTTPLIKFGWQILFDIYHYFRIPLQARFSLRMFQKNTNYEIKPVKKIEEIVDIHNNNYKTYPIRKTFNEQTLKWKLSNPRFTFENIGIYMDGILKGYVIYYIFNNKVMLYDAAFIDNDAKAESLLFAWLDTFMLDNRYEGIITISQKNIYYSQILTRNGFIRNRLPFGPLRNTIPFMIITNFENQDFYTKPGNWAIIPFCHDSF